MRSLLLRNVILLPGLALLAGGVAAAAVENRLRLEYRARNLPQAPSFLHEVGLDRLNAAPDFTRPSPVAPRDFPGLPLRIVDEGGVGILANPEQWGRDYSHHTLAFEHMLLGQAPYVDTQAFSEIERDWDTYIRRMHGFGYTGVSLRRFLELVNFDKLEDGRRIYPADDPGRAERVAVRAAFQRLLRRASRVNMQTYLYTDMAALNTPLEKYLQHTAGLEADRPAFWKPYRAALEELFTELPEVSGVIIRVGEAGAVYNAPGVDYRSALLVRDDRSLQTMLRELLPVFERHGKTLIFRTWTVGVGEIGDLHTNPQTYERALGGINSPNLIVATKYCMGDYDSFLPLNPTLFGGPHRRIIEFQARREYEGAGSIPNYMGPLHQTALLEILSKNPRIEGAWVWTQTGGPLRAGPMNLYPLYGFWRWNDLNTYHLGELLRNPAIDSRAVLRRWLANWPAFSPDEAATLEGLLLASHELTELGLYIRPAAKKEVRALGLEPPPLLWLWGFVAGSSSELATAYALARDELQSSIEEPYEAAAVLREFGSRLRSAASSPAPGPGAARDQERDRARALQSIDYSADLFETLGAYRRFFLRYHLWLDEGGETRRQDWLRDLGEFRARLEQHERLYRTDLQFPAFNFFAANIGAELMLRSPDMAWIARGLCAGGFILALVFVLQWRRERPFGPWQVRIMAGALAALTLLTAAVFSSFASLQFLLVSAAPAIVFGMAYALSLRDSRGRSVHAVAALWRFIPLLLVCLLPCVLRGPAHFWHLFWISPVFRVVWIGAYVAILIWMSLMLAVDSGVRSGRSRRFVVSGALYGLGAAVLWMAGVLLLQGFEHTLAQLTDEMAALPLLLSRVLGLATHLNLSPAWPGLLAALGASCCALAAGLRRGLR